MEYINIPVPNLSETKAQLSGYKDQLITYKDQVSDLVSQNEWLKEQLLKAKDQRKAIKAKFNPIKMAASALKAKEYNRGLKEGMMSSRKSAVEHGRKWGMIYAVIICGAGFGVFFYFYNKIQKKKIKRLKKELRRVKKEAGIED